MSSTERIGKFGVSSVSTTGLRVRREYVAREAINSRAWDNFHATPPTQTASDRLKSPVYMDMNPISSRINMVEYRLQPEYTPEPFSPYTRRLDAAGSDARNLVREMRGAVFEDNRDTQMSVDRDITERQFRTNKRFV
jgi:hypothetical protein